MASPASERRDKKGHLTKVGGTESLRAERASCRRMSSSNMEPETTTFGNDPGSAALHASALIETRDLQKSYGSGTAEIAVLSGINVSVESGKLVAVIGPS